MPKVVRSDVTRVLSKYDRPLSRGELAQALRCNRRSLSLRLTLSAMVDDRSIKKSMMRPGGKEVDPLKHEPYYQLIGTSKQLAQS